jgi:hypothetical protein
MRGASAGKLLVALLLAASLMAPTFAPAAAAAACADYHTVRRGETLAGIAREYGVSWPYLADINNLPNANRIYTGQRLCVQLGDELPGDEQPGPVPGQSAVFAIVSVEPNRTVTIQTANFPANTAFVALMDAYGTQAANGIRVGRFNSGQGGKFRLTLNIPDYLRDEARIAIRLEAPATGYYTYNWFYNTGTGTGGPYEDPGPIYQGIPTIGIASVVRNQTVTIRTNNFPANARFRVRMGHIGTRAENGILVGTIDSGKGGSFLVTFDIPAGLKGDARIAIRLDSTAGGYYSYNWFYNNTR